MSYGYGSAPTAEAMVAGPRLAAAMAQLGGTEMVSVEATTFCSRGVTTDRLCV